MLTLVKKDLLKWPFSKSSDVLAHSNSQWDLASLVTLADEDLASAFKKGNEHAFGILLSRHQKPIFNFLYKSLHDHSFAEDGFQEVFLRVVRSIKEYKPTAKFTTWLYTIARNYCIDFNRKQRFRNHLSLDHQETESATSLMDRLPVETIHSDELVDKNNLENVLSQVLKNIPDEQKEVFLMRETQGLQFDEIAKITHTSINTVKSRMRYAIQAIQKQLLALGVVTNKEGEL